MFAEPQLTETLARPSPESPRKVNPLSTERPARSYPAGDKSLPEVTGSWGVDDSGAVLITSVRRRFARKPK